MVLPAPLALLATLGAIWLLSDRLASYFQGVALLLTRSPRTASMAYDLLAFPGVVVHESAHIVLAWLLRVRVIRADLFRFRRGGDTRQGEVIVQRVDALRMSLIGAAPLLFGVPLVLWLLGRLPVPPIVLSTAVLDLLHFIAGAPGNALGLYLVWAVANTMFPSAADRAAWWVLGVIALAVAVVFLLAGERLAIPLAVQQSLLGYAVRLTNGLLPVLVLDLLLLLLLVCLEWLASRLTGRRVIRR
jgi:hypothetical protein